LPNGKTMEGICNGRLQVPFFYFKNKQEQRTVLCCRNGGRLRIDSSTIGMESAGTMQVSKTTVKRFLITDYQSQDEGEKETALSQETEKGVTSLEDHRQKLATNNTRRIGARNTETTVDNIRELTVRYIFELLFSARRERFKEWLSGENLSTQGNLTSGTMQGGNLTQYSLVSETYYAETQSMSFSTTGTVKTADGRTIDFGVQIQMSSSFESYYRQELAGVAVSLCDPIVLNFDTDICALEDQTFYFDLDADGEKDEITSLGAGSGFLALDLNGNGVIDDGRELFGTSSQNGFADLAKYDSDGNGWIDENDEVFQKLLIYCHDASGRDTTFSLQEKGIGAICLSNVTTEFGYKNDANQLQGQARRTGIFLYEDGRAGTLQHIDLAKYEKNA